MKIGLVDALIGRFPPYVQKALLSPNVRTIKKSKFFNKMESGKERQAIK
jgi:hypothetical protein